MNTDEVMIDTPPTFMERATHVLKVGVMKGAKYGLMLIGFMAGAITLYTANDGPRLLWVKTKSLYPGWYTIYPEQPIQLNHGDIVRWNFVPPEWLRKIHPEVPPKQYLKRVEGVPGDIVRWEGDMLVVCDIFASCRNLGKALPHDGNGKRFLKAVIASPIPPDHYLLYADHPTSMDSRYLGLIPITSINGTAKPLSVEKIDYPAIAVKLDEYFRTHPAEAFNEKGEFVGAVTAATIVPPSP